jgi:hypothetical protein
VCGIPTALLAHNMQLAIHHRELVNFPSLSIVVCSSKSSFIATVVTATATITPIIASTTISLGLLVGFEVLIPKRLVLRLGTILGMMTLSITIPTVIDRFHYQIQSTWSSFCTSIPHLSSTQSVIGINCFLHDSFDLLH